MKSLKTMLVSIGIGIALGFFLGPKAIFFSPVTGFCIGIFKFVVGPLVFSSLVLSITSLQKNSFLKLGGTTLITFVILTILGMLAAVLVVGTIPIPEIKINSIQVQNVPTLSFVQWATTLLPTTFLGTLSVGNVTQIMICAVLVGLGIRVNDKAKHLLPFIGAVYEISMTWMRWVIRILPVFISILIANTIGVNGLAIGKSFGIIIFCVAISCVIHVGITYSLFIRTISKKPLALFWKHSVHVGSTALATTSAAATLPVTISAMKNLGISEDLVQFVAPFGAVANKGGTAIYHVVIIGVICNIWGIAFTPLFVLKAGFMILATSLATGSVPGAGLVGVSLLINILGLPMEAFGIAAAIDRCTDMIRTPTNVVGDCVAGLILEKVVRSTK